MLDDRDTYIWEPNSLPAVGSDRLVFVDLDGTLRDRALDLRAHLALLAEERLAARDAGLDNLAYLEDLALEVADTSFVHAGAVVLQIVRLRTEFDGRNQG